MTLPAPASCRLRRGATIDLGELVRAEDGGAARWPTRVRLSWLAERLIVRFECEDDDAWGELSARDAPLWTEEVVEIFVAPGGATPRRYFEIELSPRGVVFDAAVDCPRGDRRELVADAAWDCPGLETKVEPTGRAAGWRASISLPWSSLGPPTPPASWRLNLYRIERPRDGGAPEFSAWSPTFVTPADFHRPERFGHLELAL